jgi:lipopolysaccharide transport system permease protein
MSTVVTNAAVEATAERMVAAGPIHVIEPWKPGVLARLAEVWHDRRLLPYFGRRFVTRRYQNTWLGWIWLPLRPGLDMLSKGFFFGGVLQVQSGNRPYIIFFTFGSCGWVLFDSMNKWGIRGIRMSNRFVRKAYCPRLPRLLGIVFPAALDLLLYTIVAIVAVFYYLATRGKLYVYPSAHVSIALAGIVLLALWGLTIALWMAPFTLTARDIRYGFNYLTQLWYFVTPIAYPISSMPPKYQPIAELNPLTAPIEMVKYGFLDTAAPTTKELISSFIGLSVFLIGGLIVFSRMERAAVDRL